MGNLRLPGCQDRRRFPVRETEEPSARAHEKAGALDPYPDVMELSPTCNGIESAGRRAITDEVVSRRILQSAGEFSGGLGTGGEVVCAATTQGPERSRNTTNCLIDHAVPRWDGVYQTWLGRFAPAPIRSWIAIGADKWNLLEGLTQLAPQYLARWRARDDINKVNLARLLVSGKTIGDKVAKFFGERVRRHEALAENDEGARDFSGVEVGLSDYPAITDGGMFKQKRFDFGRGDGESFVFDHLFAAVEDVVEA